MKVAKAAAVSLLKALKVKGAARMGVEKLTEALNDIDKLTEGDVTLDDADFDLAEGLLALDDITEVEVVEGKERKTRKKRAPKADAPPKKTRRRKKTVVDDDSEEEEEEEEEDPPKKTRRKRATKKAASSANKGPKRKTVAKKKTTAKRAPREPGVPSAKELIWKVWRKKKSASAESLIAKTDTEDRVQLSTVKRWLSAWAKGNKLPAAATK